MVSLSLRVQGVVKKFMNPKGYYTARQGRHYLLHSDAMLSALGMEHGQCGPAGHQMKTEAEPLLHPRTAERLPGPPGLRPGSGPSSQPQTGGDPSSSHPQEQQGTAKGHPDGGSQHGKKRGERPLFYPRRLSEATRAEADAFDKKMGDRLREISYRRGSCGRWLRLGKTMCDEGMMLPPVSWLLLRAWICHVWISSCFS